MRLRAANGRAGSCPTANAAFVLVFLERATLVLPTAPLDLVIGCWQWHLPDNPITLPPTLPEHLTSCLCTLDGEEAAEYAEDDKEIS